MTEPSAADTGAMVKYAVMDSTGRYRYLLSRRWDDGPSMCFIMLNPSTADAEQDDPTIRRCIGIARAWRFGSIVVVNLYAFRATNPKLLKMEPDPIGPDNDRFILEAAAGTFIVAAWGNHAEPGRAGHILRMLSGRPINCLGLTKSGQPKHPLYVKSDALALWRNSEEERR